MRLRAAIGTPDAGRRSIDKNAGHVRRQNRLQPPCARRIAHGADAATGIHADRVADRAGAGCRDARDRLHRHLEARVLPKDIAFLRNHPTLKRLSYQKMTEPAEDFWKAYDARQKATPKRAMQKAPETPAAQPAVKAVEKPTAATPPKPADKAPEKPAEKAEGKSPEKPAEQPAEAAAKKAES